MRGITLGPAQKFRQPSPRRVGLWAMATLPGAAAVMLPLFRLFPGLLPAARLSGKASYVADSPMAIDCSKA